MHKVHTPREAARTLRPNHGTECSNISSNKHKQLSRCTLRLPQSDLIDDASARLLPQLVPKPDEPPLKVTLARAQNELPRPSWGHALCKPPREAIAACQTPMTGTLAKPQRACCAICAMLPCRPDCWDCSLPNFPVLRRPWSAIAPIHPAIYLVSCHVQLCNCWSLPSAWRDG